MTMRILAAAAPRRGLTAIASVSFLRSSSSAMTFPFARHFAYLGDASKGNHLVNVSSLKNDFCALRHGQSMANVQQIISSHPDVATMDHGLSPLGREQAEAAAKDVVDYYNINNRDGKYSGIIILTSDYLRAKETAKCVGAAVLKAGLPLYRRQFYTIDTALRERWFGDWDGGSDENYANVWKDDAVDPSHTNGGVEAVNAVMDRTTACVIKWNEKLNQHLIVLVAHGDVLQIAQTAFSKLDGSKHRTLEHLETATLRPLKLLV